MKDESLIPISKDKKPCPQELLQIIRYSFKESCRRVGLKCSKSCKECLRVTYENTLTSCLEMLPPTNHFFPYKPSAAWNPQSVFAFVVLVFGVS